MTDADTKSSSSKQEHDVVEKTYPTDGNVPTYDGEHVTTPDDVNETGESEELHRALTPAQISMIAIGGSIGTGLIIGTGSALTQGGPAGLLIGYSIMGAVCWVVLTALGEMSAYMPSKNGFQGHAARFCDEALGTAVGYNYLFKYLVITPNQINASALLISFWRPDLSGGIFISVFIVCIVASNLCGVKFFGHVEFWMSFAKIVVLTAIILGGFIISLGGNPTGDRIGFRYWNEPGAFVEYKAGGAKGRFLGTWSVMSLALFAYIGSELVGVCVGESKNPRKSIPKAISKVVWRILWFYICGVIVIGMLVASNDPRLKAKGTAKSTASASPFVVAIISAKIQTLPSVINGALLIFTLSASNSDLYIASRTLYGLAVDGKAPRIFLRCNRMGVPYVALGFSSLFCALAFLNLSSGGGQTFTYLTSTVSIFGGLAWVGILFAHIRFMAGCKAQGVSRDTLPYKAPFQPYASYIAIFVTMLVLIFKGFTAFLPTFDYKSFITSYIGFPIFFVIWLGWKVVYKTKFYSASEMDVINGARRFDGLDDGTDENEEMRLAPWYKKPLVYAKNF